MKKIYFLLFTLLITSLSFGQVIVADGFSYPDGSLVGNGGWVNHSGTPGDLLVSANQVVIQHGAPSEDANVPFTPVAGEIFFGIDFSVTSGSVIPGTDNEYFASFRTGFNLRGRIDVVPGTGGGDYTVGISSSTSTAQAIWGTDLTFGTMYRAIVSYDQDSGLAKLWIDASSSGDTNISGMADGSTSIESFAFRQSDSDNNETIRVDDLMIGQTFNDVLIFVPPTDPTLSIPDGPANGSTVIDDPETATPGNAGIDFATTNFGVGEPGTGTEADGYIVWSAVNINNGANNDGGNIYTANDGFEYPVVGLINGETYFFRSELVNNAGDPLSIPVVYSFTITIAEYIDVANLAALRASTVDPDLYYRVTGPVINTNRDADMDGQTLHFQDGTAGIKVFDPDYEVQTVYNRGDAVTNIRGRLFSVNDVLQFVPTYADWGAPISTGNSPNIPTVTIATLITDWEMYESELVNVNGVAFADAGGTFVEASGPIGNYDISDVSGGPIVFRTDFGTANYIGQTIPSGNQNMVVIVSEFFGDVQVTARDLSDFTLNTQSFDLDSFKIYPNPTATGFVNITSTNADAMSVVVYDILGKQVINESLTNNRLNVSALNTGIYILKISQNNASVTKKLVIK